LGRHRGVGHEHGKPPAGVWQPLVELLGDDPDAAGGGGRDVVEVSLVRAGVDDMALHVPGAVERGGSQARRGTAAEPDPERYLAADASFHAETRKRVVMRGEILGAFAFEVPRRMFRKLGLDLEPEVDGHGHAVEAGADVGAGAGHEYA